MLTPPPLLWHHKVHEAWADEKLVFILIAYEPTYNRDDAVERLQDFLIEREILSYQLYEITSPHDILVRAWVPKRMSFHELKKDLLKSHDPLQVAHVLPVVEIVHHWPWEIPEDGRIGRMQTPKEDILETGRPARERELINEMQRSGHAATRSRLIREARGEKILCKPDYRPGIRFLVRVKVNAAHVDNPDALQLLICRLLREAKNIVIHASVYRLEGIEQFLILGQVVAKLSDFHAISQELVSHINDSAASGGARTYTSFFATPGFLDFRDELRIPPHELQRAKLELSEIMSQPEGHRLEIKGSAFTDLDDWLKDGKKRPTPSRKPAKDAETYAVNMLMRAIASLLNSDGGHIVVGALENAHYGDCARFNALPAADPDGVHRYIGLEFEWPKGGWDKYAVRLGQVIEVRFDPVPSERWVKISQEKAGKKDICLIEVVLPDEFFWVWISDKVSRPSAGETNHKPVPAQLEKQFVVRKEGKTEVLKDTAIERYQRSTPRAPRIVT